MLADQGELRLSSGRLDRTVQLPGTWWVSLLCFIADELPKWRDDPSRPTETSETILTSQLCAYMNSATRLSRGWDFLQFRTEEADETVRSRKVDLVPAASGTTIWIKGRQYSQYAALLPIECKRLPTPAGSKRDEREYLFSVHNSTGGVQRYKAGHHGASHSVGALIAYIQEQDIEFWSERIRLWLNGLVGDRVSSWDEEDALGMTCHDGRRRTAVLRSVHRRCGELPPIQLYHLWVNMNGGLVERQ